MIIRKRPKLLDQLLNTNWSKSSQQGSNLNKLNRLLLTSELNVIDEKSGQSPLGLVILSPAINYNNPKQQQQANNNGSGSLLSSSSSSTTLSAAAATINPNSVSSHHLQSSSSTLNHSLSSILSHSSNSTTTTTSSSNQGSTTASQLNDHLSSTLPKDSSLFALQCQSSGLSLDQVLATSVSDLILSKAPLVERIIQLMVKAGARLDLTNNDSRTPLHLAAQKSNFWALKTLLDLGAESDCRDANGLTPLYYSIIERADLKVTQLLLSHQCQSFIQHPDHHLNNYYSINNNNNNSNNNENDIDGKTSTNQSSLLSTCIGLKDAQGWQEVHHACKLGLDSHLEKLLYYGCDMNAKIDGSGNTPLHVAAINDQINCVKVLLMRGADKTITNSSHQTALQVAVISGNMDIAEFISEHTSSQVIPFKNRPSDFIRGFAALSTQLNGNNNNITKQPQQHQYANYPLATSNNNTNNDTTINPLLRQMSTRSVLVSSQSNFQLGSSTTSSSMMQNYHNNHNHHSSQRFADNQRLQQFRQMNAGSNNNNCNKILSPLSLELIDTETLDSFPTPPTTTNTSTSTSSSGLNHLQQSHSQHIQHNHNHHLNADEAQQSQQFLARNPNMCIPSELNNVSPCLSQRSFATSNTTSSSGVGMDGDGTTSANDEDSASGSLQRNNHQINNLLLMNSNSYSQGSNHHSIDQSASQHSNITVISIGQQAPSSLPYTSDSSVDDSCQQSNQQARDEQGRRSSDTGSSRSDTESCTDDLYSLMLDERPLVAGSIVEATSDYHSGDPSHLELHRGDLIEILNCSPDLLHCGQLPRMANKPMLYGRHYCNNNGNDVHATGGLFPSFCVRRTKLHNHQHTRHMKVNETPTAVYSNDKPSETDTMNNGQQRTANVVESQSLLELAGNCNSQQQHSSSLALLSPANCSSSMTSGNLIFEEFQVNLVKTNGGFGFVLRGAKIDPESLAIAAASAANANGDNQHRALSTLDEELLKKNNLASLQYLDEIEPNSVADKAGLRRGDFLVAVNNHDVRLKSHEQVVRMVRESGQQVHLTIATTKTSPSSSRTTSTSATTEQKLHHHQQQQNQKECQLQSSQMQPNSSFNLSSSTSSMMLMGSQPTYASSRTLGRIKPEPPKRDPTTTLSRNHNKTKMLLQQQQGSKDVPSANAAASEVVAQPTAPKHHEDSHSMASTLSLHNTPTHNSTSSGSTQTTVEANTVVSQATIIHGQQVPMTASSGSNKPNPPPKPAQMATSRQNSITSSPALSVDHINQPIYQPAVMTTTTRRRQSVAAFMSTDVPSTLRGKERGNGNSTRMQAEDLPPPPPPLPDFSQAMPRNSGMTAPPPVHKFNHANDQNRLSVQLEMRSGFGGLQLDAEALRRKRSSLAVVSGSNGSTMSSMGSTGGPSAPELGSVAAACAAAANSRLQRQKQMQNSEITASIDEKQQDVEAIKPNIIKNNDGQASVQHNSIHLETAMKPLPPPPLLSNSPLERPTTQVIKSNCKNSSQKFMENMDPVNTVRQQGAIQHKEQQEQQKINYQEQNQQQARQVGATITNQVQNCQYPAVVVSPQVLHQQQPNPEHLILIQKQQQHLQQHKQSLLQRQPTLELQQQYHNYQQQPILVTQNNNNNKQQAQCQLHPDQVKLQQQQYYIKQQQQLPQRCQPVPSQQQQQHYHSHHHQNNNKTNHTHNRASNHQDNWQRHRQHPDLVAQVHPLQVHHQQQNSHQHRHSYHNHAHAHSAAGQHLTQLHVHQHQHPNSHQHSHNHLHNHQHHQMQQHQHHHNHSQMPQHHNQTQNVFWYAPTQ